MKPRALPGDFASKVSTISKSLIKNIGRLKSKKISLQRRTMDDFYHPDLMSETLEKEESPGMDFVDVIQRANMRRKLPMKNEHLRIGNDLEDVQLRRRKFRRDKLNTSTQST